MEAEAGEDTEAVVDEASTTRGSAFEVRHMNASRSDG